MNLRKVGFEARITPASKRANEHPHATVWVRIDLGNGPEWLPVASIRKP